VGFGGGPVVGTLDQCRVVPVVSDISGRWARRSPTGAMSAGFVAENWNQRTYVPDRGRRGPW